MKNCCNKCFYDGECKNDGCSCHTTTPETNWEETVEKALKTLWTLTAYQDIDLVDSTVRELLSKQRTHILQEVEERVEKLDCILVGTSMAGGTLKRNLVSHDDILSLLTQMKEGTE